MTTIRTKLRISKFNPLLSFFQPIRKLHRPALVRHLLSVHGLFAGKIDIEDIFNYSYLTTESQQLDFTVDIPSGHSAHGFLCPLGPILRGFVICRSLLQIIEKPRIQPKSIIPVEKTLPLFDGDEAPQENDHEQCKNVDELDLNFLENYGDL